MRSLIISLFFAIPVAAAELTIFDVRKPIALSDKEITQKDFYINAGAEAGLQKGMIVTVIRKVPLYDTYQSRSAGDLTVPVAKVKIIQVQQGNSVARFASEINRADVPTLEENFILVGDRLDLSTATHEKKSADASESEEKATAATEKRTPAPAPLVPELPPPPAQITSKRIDEPANVPKDPALPTQGPTIQ